MTNTIKNPQKQQEMYDYIIKIAENFNNNDLKKVVLYIYTEYKDQILKCSGGKIHHKLPGEFIVHIYDMLNTAEAIVQIYDSEVINKDLLFASIMIHDIGKVLSIKFDDNGLALFDTKESVLLSTHIYVGAAYIRELCNKLNVNPDISLELQHILLSHHGYRAEDEASLSDPMLPEAYILHMCDALDSRLDLIKTSLTRIKPGDKIHIGKNRFYRSVLALKKEEEYNEQSSE